MLRTFLVGAIAAYAGSRLIRANEDGRLDTFKTKARDGADRLRQRLNAQPGLLSARAKPSRKG